MSPTLLEFALAIVLIVVAWQIGLIIAPRVIRALGQLRRDVDEATEEALAQPQNDGRAQHTEEHRDGTH